MVALGNPVGILEIRGVSFWGDYGKVGREPLTWSQVQEKGNTHPCSKIRLQTSMFCVLVPAILVRREDRGKSANVSYDFSRPRSAICHRDFPFIFTFSLICNRVVGMCRYREWEPYLTSTSRPYGDHN
jgi:hypothetical protein